MKALKILMSLVVTLTVIIAVFSSCGNGGKNNEDMPSANSSTVTNNGDNASSTLNSGNADNSNDDEKVHGTRVVIDGVVYTLNEDGKSYTATELQNGYGEDIVIQESCNGKNVVGLSGELFENVTGVKSISIPKTVTEIGYPCFANCSDLTSITVAEGNTAYKSADGNLYTVDGKTLVAYAVGKTNESFAFPDGVEIIYDRSFMNCTALKSIQLSTNLRQIGSYAFEGCTSLSGVELPTSLDGIGDGAFAKCTSIETITIPTYASVGTYVFAYCTSLKEILVAEGNYMYRSINGDLYTVEGIKLVQYAIGKEDTYFELPDDCVVKIGNGAFCGAENLVSVKLANEYDVISEISMGAFKDCINLESVYIGKTVEKMDMNVFIGCEKATIYCEHSESLVEGLIEHSTQWSNLWNPNNCLVVYSYEME